jgi:hypothetical protein
MLVNMMPVIKQPARSPLVLFFQARFEYLSCVRKGPKDELPEKLKVESKQGILKQLALARTINMQDAIALTNMLNESKLPDDAATDIHEAIQMKADIQGDASPAASLEKVRQMHTYLENYQAAGDWECYAGQASHENKLLQMARRMHSIFLYYPTEPTISAAVAVALYVDGPHDPSYLLAKVRQMKGFLQSMFKTSGPPPAADVPKVFPAEVQHFKETHSVVFAAAFATDLPAACPVPAVMMQILKSGAPCRKTRMGCNDFAAHAVKHTGRSQATRLPSSTWTRCAGISGLSGPRRHVLYTAVRAVASEAGSASDTFRCGKLSGSDTSYHSGTRSCGGHPPGRGD